MSLLITLSIFSTMFSMLTYFMKLMELLSKGDSLNAKLIQKKDTIWTQFVQLGSFYPLWRHQKTRGLFLSAIFHQSDSPSKTMKMYFISSKTLLPFLRYSNFCIFVFPSFFTSAIALEGDSRKILKVYDVIICLNKNLIICFVWYLEKEIRCDIETLAIDIKYGTFLWKK